MTLRSQFPFFNNSSNVYLDSAASTQKPQMVITAITDFYSSTYSSNHGVHNLANNLNENIEECRTRIAKFINANSSKEIVFTSGATESFNLIANAIQVPKSKANVLIYIAEHHSNLLPWQVLAQKNNLEIRYFGLTKNGEIDYVDFESKLDSKTLLVAITHCSNVLGIVNNIEKISTKCTELGAISIVDATQSIVHTDINVREINCDFLAFSGHKIYGPTGIGVLYGKSEQLEKLDNYKVGGEMVELVTKEKNYWKEIPYRFEAGTINLAGIIGLNSALEWFADNRNEIFVAEDELHQYCQEKLIGIKNLKLITNQKPYNPNSNTFTKITTTLNPNPAVILNSFQDPFTIENKSQNTTNTPIFTFTITGINSYDLAEYLNLKNISVRVGQHCTGLLHEYLGIESTLRISLACYNTKEEIDKVINEIKNGIEKLKF
jgi:cysteine desulfurase / selenocysteine lyase